MEILPLLRMLGALGVVLGLLVGALWAVRRFQIRLPGAVGGGGPTRRLELGERVSMDSRRSVAVVRRDGREHLLLLAPEGNTVIETAILRDAVDLEAEQARLAAAEAAAVEAAEAAARARAEFKAMVDKTVERLDEAREGARERGQKLVGRLGEGARQAIEKARQQAERRKPGEPEAPLFTDQLKLHDEQPRLPAPTTEDLFPGEAGEPAEPAKVEEVPARVRKPRQPRKRPAASTGTSED